LYKASLHEDIASVTRCQYDVAVPLQKQRDVSTTCFRNLAKAQKFLRGCDEQADSTSYYFEINPGITEVAFLKQHQFDLCIPDRNETT